MKKLTLIPGKATLEQLEQIVQDPFAKSAQNDGIDQLEKITPLAVEIASESKVSVDKSFEIVSAVVKGDKAVYGVNTGFGKLASVRIAVEDTATLQRNLILSHCAGVGEDADVRITRLMMALKLLSLGRGASGVRWELIALIQQLLSHGITPRIPVQGSVGASGDLAPLAHFAAVLIGEGEALYRGEHLNGGQALASAGLSPLVLTAKEGLALINGTQFSTASALVALFDVWHCMKSSVLASALSTDAIMGSTAPLRAEIHELRGHQGQIDVADGMRCLMAGSEIRESHRADDIRVQDPYCIRCQPQVAGACVELLRQAANTLQIEANAVTDNPLVVETDDGVGAIISGGNFHAEPVAFAADQIALAIAEVGAIAQRRVALMVDPVLSFDLPPFLTPDPGLCSGFMVAEITTAALMSENKHLANPCSTDSTPTSANQEDHVSMAAHAAQRLHRMNKNLANIVGVELLCGSEGVECRAPLKTSAALQNVLKKIRQTIPKLAGDRFMAPDLRRAAELVQSGELVEASGIELLSKAVAS